MNEKVYSPSWESLNTRPCPSWFTEAKFGIFVSWGPYSVPAYKKGPGYAEWIGHPGRGWMEDPFIQQSFGEHASYDTFVDQFHAELYDPYDWADFIRKSGAKYVFMTAKYHDGFCLWPSKYAVNGRTDQWHAGSRGPKKDLLAPFFEAMRAKGLITGLYWSLHEWFHPLCGDNTDDFFYCKDPEEFAVAHMHPQFKEMVERYRPDLIFADGDTIHPDKWKTAEMIAWLYNESSVKENVVINDRFGFWKDEKYGRGKIGDYYTTEFGFGRIGSDRLKPWEENRGIGTSFGYNRTESVHDYKSAFDLIALLIDTVSKGGNLALNVGPSADGRIPVIMQQRLLEIGHWLQVNGEAIYGTSQWIKANEDETESGLVSVNNFEFDGSGNHEEEKIAKRICYTAKGNVVYTICIGWPGELVALKVPFAMGDIQGISMLGYDEAVQWSCSDGWLGIHVPPLTIDKLPCYHAWTFKIVIQ